MPRFENMIIGYAVVVLAIILLAALAGCTTQPMGEELWKIPL